MFCDYRVLRPETSISGVNFSVNGREITEYMVQSLIGLISNGRVNGLSLISSYPEVIIVPPLSRWLSIGSVSSNISIP